MSAAILSFLFTGVLMLAGWIYFFILILSKSNKRRSGLYMFFAITYAAHSMSSILVGLSGTFYMIFSIIFFLLHLFYKRVEKNLSSDDDINKN